METLLNVTIPSGTLSLEGILEYPEEAAGPFPGAVICHPHPQFGGNMHNNVVRSVRKALIERGFACLRFNFRGVGRSWGSYGGGVDELADVAAAVDFMVHLDRVRPSGMLVAGYSFGSWVGLKAGARDKRVNRLIGVSPPINEYNYGFLNTYTEPKFLIVGDNDFVCSVENFRRVMDDIPEPKYGVVLPGVDHFHVGTEPALITEINTFLDKFLQ